MSRKQAGLPWGVVIILCATIGLAPFHPPHLFEKMSLLLKGVPLAPLDWFDLVLHGSPWLLLGGKLASTIYKGLASSEEGDRPGP